MWEIMTQGQGVPAQQVLRVVHCSAWHFARGVAFVELAPWRELACAYTRCVCWCVVLCPARSSMGGGGAVTHRRLLSKGEEGGLAGLRRLIFVTSSYLAVMAIAVLFCISKLSSSVAFVQPSLDVHATASTVSSHHDNKDAGPVPRCK